MIVYAESNVVLELAFLRKDHQDAERLLELSESGTISVCVPALPPIPATIGIHTASTAIRSIEPLK